MLMGMALSPDSIVHTCVVPTPSATDTRVGMDTVTTDHHNRICKTYYEALESLMHACIYSLSLS